MRILVAMSGGVDSSVVAGLLAEEGHEVVGATLQLYDYGAALKKKGACCAGQDIHYARDVADRLGIPREATLAIGDSENDRAMLARAGVAAVMANALPEIRALGDIVSTRDNDHDGVAELFERLGL